MEGGQLTSWPAVDSWWDGDEMVDASRLLRAEMAEIAASAGPVERRADALLRCLNGMVPYDAAWVAVRDPETRMHRRVGSDGDTGPLARYFACPDADDEVEAIGMNRRQPPVPASALPVPLAETRAWGEYLLPAGFRDGVAMPLFTEDGRHLGFVSLLTDEPVRWSDSYVTLLAGLRPIFVDAFDRLPGLAAVARMTGDALGGVAITRAGRALHVPGLTAHPLVAEDTAASALALRYVRAPGTAASFLSPWGRSVLRVTVLDCSDDTADHLCALALVRPADDAMDLGLTDLQLLGALVDGWDADQIRNGVGLTNPSNRVAKLAAELGLPDAAALVQHAARTGLHLPPFLWRQVDHRRWRRSGT